MPRRPGAVPRAERRRHRARRAHDTTLLDATNTGSGPRPLPVDPTLRKPYDQAATASLPTRDVPTGAVGVAPGGSGQAPLAHPGARDPRPTGPVRTTGGRPAGPPIVRSDRDRTPTGSAPISRRPNRKFEHRRTPSLIVVGGLLLVATIVSAILWNTLGTDSDGDEFPTPTTAALGVPTDAAPVPDPSADGTDPSSATAAAPDPGVTSGSSGLAAAGLAGARTWDSHAADPAENDDQIALVTDGDPGTSWSTLCYADDRLDGEAVGVALTLPTASQGTLEVEIDAEFWTVEVYGSLAPGMPATLDAWGERVASESGGTNGVVSLEMMASTLHVLVVFREVGPSNACTDAYPFSGGIAEVRFDALA